jgi:hypothetical protein
MMGKRDSFEKFMETLAKYCLTSPIPDEGDVKTMRRASLADAKPLFDDAVKEAALRLSERDEEEEWEEPPKTREHARRGEPLNGADAQALEATLQRIETDLEEARLRQEDGFEGPP